jgi:uncharacterized membrane protein YfcA
VFVWIAIFGTVVGLSLGLTGGGGSLFAVPLLVYGAGREVEEAVSISLVSIGATALMGAFAAWREGVAEPRTGLIVAIAGAAGAPFGTALAVRLPPAIVLTLFAFVMLVVATQLWRKAAPRGSTTDTANECDPDQGACRRDEGGRLNLTSRCAIVLAVVGLVTGVLTGLLGVGGGFAIVPALVLFSRMPIRVAVGTSLMVVAIVSASGVASRLMTGMTFDPVVTAIFLAGGVAGMFAGRRLARLLSGPVLQRLFAAAIVAVAVFVIVGALAGRTS